MAKFFVTYGNVTRQARCYSVVERDSRQEARDYVFRVIGGAFAFMYDEDQWKEHTGQTQAERFGLIEIPLQAHEKY
jgi:hypothetical protein